jgi:hypothetical protein
MTATRSVVFQTKTDTGSDAQMKENQRFRSKLSPDTEGACLLVAATEFVSRPVNAFVRLHEAVVFEELLEVTTEGVLCIPTQWQVGEKKSITEH